MILNHVWMALFPRTFYFITNMVTHCITTQPDTQELEAAKSATRELNPNGIESDMTFMTKRHSEERENFTSLYQNISC